MEIVYKIKTKELNSNIIDAIKSMFKDEEIIISVVSAKKEKKLTAKYSQKILDSVKNIEEGKIVYFTKDEFENLSKELLEK